MSITATIHPAWQRKWIIMSMVILLMGGWFAYDGFITYPNKNAQFAAYEKLESEDRAADWETLAMENGWPKQPPSRQYTGADILIQKVLMVVCVCLGLVGIGFVIAASSRSISVDETQIKTSNGLTIPLSAVTHIDKSSWESKGIAMVTYTAEGGRESKVKIDRVVYQNSVAVLESIEEQTGLVSRVDV